MKNDNPIESFWSAVTRQDYDTVRKAIADGIDVNAKIPGKVAPIIFAQPAEDMVMLKILWEAGANPATPWLEEVFADFANGGDGSIFKRKKLKAVGNLTLHRYNGDEIFEINKAVIQIVKNNGKSWLVIEISSDGTIVKGLPDTVNLGAMPSAQIAIPVEESEIENLVGKKFLLPNAYDEEIADYLSTIYYVEHEPLEGNEIEFISKKKNKFLLKWLGQTKDVNYYDGSKPNTRVEIESWVTRESKNA
jgi:hypothetical protein